MSINVAILGLGTVGYGVYDIISNNHYLKNEGVKVTRILDKDISKQKLVNGIITNDYDLILNDKSISVIIETMGAKDFSYKCIKEAIIHQKHVITANKEVIASHIKELTLLKEDYNVSLYYEASVGGGIPLIKPVHLLALTNEVSEINGILNGTTNFILSKMTNDNLTFFDALQLAQEKGFAESDPTADLEGLDMVRKIAILSSICYKAEINLDNIYHYGISTISDLDVKFASKNDYMIKFVATSHLIEKDVELKVEPVLVKNDSLFSTVNNEFNIVSIKSNINGELMFYGKGAGRYPTANAIINDLIMIMNNDKNYSFHSINNLEYKRNKVKDKNMYYLRVKDINKVSKDIIDVIERNQIITKEISAKELDLIKSDIYFYARIM